METPHSHPTPYKQTHQQCALSGGTGNGNPQTRVWFLPYALYWTPERKYGVHPHGHHLQPEEGGTDDGNIGEIIGEIYSKEARGCKRRLARP